MRDMLYRGKEVVSKGSYDIGKAGVTSHQIVLTDATPIRIKPRRFSEPVTQEVERQCQELLQHEII